MYSTVKWSLQYLTEATNAQTDYSLTTYIIFIVTNRFNGLNIKITKIN